jgi:hypothetical protein
MSFDFGFILWGDSRQITSTSWFIGWDRAIEDSKTHR